MRKTARNEQRKLGASLLNAVGAGILTTTIIAVGTRLLSAQGWLPLLVALAAVIAFHLLARVVLRDLEE